MERLRSAAMLGLWLACTPACDPLADLKERVFGPEESDAVDARSSELAAAVELYESGRYEEAAVRLEALVQGDPSAADALYYLGACHLARAGDAPEPSQALDVEEQAALDAFQRALSSNPRHARAYLGIGDLYARRIPEPRRRRTPAPDDPEQLAREAYEQAVTIDPKLPEAQRRYARFLERTGDLAGAEQAYRAASEAAATVPELAPDYYVDYGHFLAEKRGRLEEAVQQYELARMFRRDDQTIQREMAVLHGRMGQDHFEKQQYALAEETLSKAYQMFPDKSDPEAEKVSAILQELRSIRRR